MRRPDKTLTLDDMAQEREQAIEVFIKEATNFLKSVPESWLDEDKYGTQALLRAFSMLDRAHDHYVLELSIQQEADSE